MRKRKRKIPKKKQMEIRPWARWFLPTVGNITLLSILCFIFINRKKFLLDGDMGVHIRTGDLILQNGFIPRSDPFSFTMPGDEWFAWEWLADVFMSWIHSAFGIPGIVGAAILLLCLVFIAFYHWMVARGAAPLVAAVLALFAARLTSIHWLARPHLISLGLLLASAVILEDYCRRRSRSIFFLPVLIVLWANLHSGFIIVYPIMAVYAAGELIKFTNRKKQSIADAGSPFRAYLLVGALSVLAGFLTPYGWALYRHIWIYLNNTALLSSIQEFQPPEFHSSTGSMVVIMLFLGTGALIQAFRERRWVDIGLLILWTCLMLRSVRHIPLAAIGAIPIMAEHWSILLQEITGAYTRRQFIGSKLLTGFGDRLRSITDFSRRLSGVFIYLAIVVFLCAIIAGPRAGRVFGFNFFSDKHPVKAAKFLATANLKGNIYATDEYGDYLIYRLYPQTKVFIDGRSDFYSTGPVWDDYIELLKMNPSWPEILEKYDVQYMLLQNDDPLGKAAEDSGEWENIYRDSYSRILARNGKTGQRIQLNPD